MKLPLWRRRQDHDLDEEIRSHLRMALEERVQRGDSRAEAEAAARREFGNQDIVREVTRDMWGWTSIDRLWHDVRHALRTLVRAPGFAAVALFTLALGIGANTAIFSVVDGVLLRPAPFADMDRLMVVWETDRNTGTTREAASLPDYEDFRARSRHLEQLGAVRPGEVNVVPSGGEPIRLPALSVTATLLPMTGIEPRLGRGFTPGEDQVGGPKVALISESLWERVFGRDPAVAGHSLWLDEVPHTIVGVLPDSADFGILQILGSAAYAQNFGNRGDRAEVDVWTPLQENADTMPRSTHPIFVLGRVGPGSTVSMVQEEMSAIAADLERAYPVNRARGAFVEPLGEVVFGGVRPALFVLLAAVGFVLLVACANVANLLLARGATRAREIAVRSALGAAPGRLARQFLVETTVLTSLAAMAAIGVAWVGLRALLALAPGDVPRLGSVGVDLRVLAVTLGGALVVGAVFSMVPTFQARRLEIATGLKAEDGGRFGSASRGRRRFRSTLVVAEIALASILVVGAGLLIRSFWLLYQVDPGFQANGVLKAEYTLPASRYPVNFAVWPDFKEIHGFNGALLARAAALPGTTSVALAGNHPLDPGFTNSFSVAGREAEARNWPEISVRRVSPGYFRTVGLPLVRGRLFAGSDTTGSSAVVVINETAAERFFAGQDPLGAQVQFWGAARTIVGIVGDERFHGVARRAPIAVYAPLSQAPSANGAGVLLVRTSGDPLALAAAVRGAIREVDPALAVFGVEPLARTFSRSVSDRRFMMLLIAVFAGVAVLLSAVGIHGLLSYRVVERTREIGIRMALGAAASNVLGQVLREGLTLAAAGLALGLAGALALTRLLAGLLFGVTPTDTATFLAVPIVVTLVAVAASLIPARRAVRVDPVTALRAE